VLLGIADLQHWNAWAVSEQAQTLHIEPLMALICAAFTDHVLHPVLDAMGEDTTGRVVWYDASELAVRPDNSDNTIALYDRILVGGTAARREAGLSDADAPTPEEVRMQVILNTVKSAPTLAPLLLPAIGISIDLPPETQEVLAQATPGTSDNTGGAIAAPPSNPATPTTGLPEQRASALTAACDGVMWRALERAGSRMRSIGGESLRASLADCTNESTHSCLGGVPVEQLDDLLAHAWGRLDDIAQRYDVDAAALTASLDTYARALLSSGRSYSYDELSLWVTTWLAAA
jgi:hypothetical protein